MKLYFLIICFIASASHILQGQKIIAEVKGVGKLDDISALSVGDSILLHYTSHNGGVRFTQAKWITESSVHSTVAGEFPSAIIRHGDSIYTYLFFKDRKEIGILVSHSHVSSKQKQETALVFESKIKLIGYYVDKNFFVITLGSLNNSIELHEIEGLRRVSVKKYKISKTIGDALVQVLPPSLYVSESEVNTFDTGRGASVFMNRKIYLCIDNPVFASDYNGIIAFDENKEEGEPIALPFPTSRNNRMHVLNDKLFHLSMDKKKMVLTIYDLESRKILIQKDIQDVLPDYPVYFRYGRRNIIHHKEKFEDLMAFGKSDALISVIRKDNKYIILCGNYFDEKGMMGPAGLSPFGLLFMIAGTAIQQLREGPGVYRYLYYEWDPSANEIKVSDQVSTIRRKIDEYEIGLRLRHDHKSYLSYKNGILAVYYDSDTDNSIKLVHFQ